MRMASSRMTAAVVGGPATSDPAGASNTGQLRQWCGYSAWRPWTRGRPQPAAEPAPVRRAALRLDLGLAGGEAVGGDAGGPGAEGRGGRTRPIAGLDTARRLPAFAEELSGPDRPGPAAGRSRTRARSSPAPSAAPWRREK